MGNSTSALPYTIGNETHSSARQRSYGYSMHNGQRKSDKKLVTVFKGEKSTMAKTPLIKGSNTRDLRQTQIFPALHHFKKCKTLIHPYILSVYATLDTDYPDGNDPSSAASKSPSIANPSSLTALEQTATTGDLIIVTEPVIPLKDYLDLLEHDPDLDNGQRADIVAWGVYNIIQATHFLHTSAKVAHGNLIPEAIFVTPAGDFKLSAFQLLTPVGIADGAVGPSDFFQQFERDVTPKEFRGPERIEGRFDAISTCPVHAMDAYSFGILLPEIYQHRGTGTMTRLPQKLEKACLRLRTSSITSRPRILPLSRCPIFDTPHMKAQKFLDEIATKSTEEKLAFWKSLPDLFSRKILPSRVAKYKILPLLQETISKLTASDMGLTQEISKIECLAILPTLFTTAVTHLSSEEFQTQLSPVIELLFKVNDRAVRGAMLGRISLFAKNLDAVSLNARVFEPMCSGFTDSSAPLRELTLKSAIVLVSHLSQPNLEKLTRYLVRMQSDPENTIRTNTVIFIGKVAPNLSSVARSKLILPAFMRAMTDPFVPCRLAGLKAMNACRALFDEKQLATEVLPAITPSLVDASGEVRDAAMRAVEDLLTILREVGERMGLEEAKKMKTPASNAVESKSTLEMGGSNASRESSDQTSTPTSASYLSGFSSWASSKISLSAKAGEAKTSVDLTTNSGRATPSTAPIPSAQLPMSQPKPTPAFSSLSLRDAGVGGTSTGWSDDEFEDFEPKNNSKKSKNLIPSFATDGGEDFWQNLDQKAAMRPRVGNATKLQTPAKVAANARRREELSKRKTEKKEKLGVMKLKIDKDPADGWDDF